MAKTLHLYLAVIFTWGNCAGQLPQLHFHHLGIENGLSQTPNEHAFKDSHGYVWASSMNGLNQFDGRTVRVHLSNPKKPGAMLGSIVQGPISEDDSTNIWFATFEGINCYDRRADAFRHFQPETTPSYLAIGLDGQGRLWFIHRLRQICTLDTRTGMAKRLHEVGENTHAGLLVPGTGGPAMLVSYSTSGAGAMVSRYGPSGELLRQQHFFDGKTPGGGPALHVSDATLTADGQVWLGTSAGLVRLDPSGPAHQLFPFGKNAIITGIAALPGGLLACATNGDGLWFFDTKKSSYLGSLRHTADDPHSLAANQLDGVDADGDGGLWVSVSGRGLDFASTEKNKFRQVPLPPSLLADGTSPKLGELLEDSQGRTWCIKDNDGVLIFDKNGRLESHYSDHAAPPLHLPGSRVYHLFEDDRQRIWLMTHSGLLVLPPGERQFRKADSTDGYLHGLQLHHGRLLFSRFTGGVWELTEEKGKFGFRQIEGPSPGSAWTILFEDSQRRLWGSRDLAAVQVFSLRKNGGYQPIAEVPTEGEVAAFYEDKNAKKTWVAASHGLHSIAEGSFLPKAEGLADLAVVAMLPDGRGNLWLGTNRGLWQLRLDDARLSSFTVADGITSLESGFQSILRRRDGSFLFGNAGGLVSRGGGAVQPIQAIAVPQLTALTLNDTMPTHLRCALTGAANPSEMREIHLRHHENLLGFTLTALEYSDPANCRIRYKLVGADPDTVEVASGTQVRYPNLPPGEYLLQAWAANSDGAWNPDPYEMAIHIRPAFWQTWWFKLLAALAFVATVASFFYLRDQQRQRLQRLRDRLSRDLHDELGSTLSSISILSESARKADEQGQQGLSLEQIGQRAREAMDSVSDMVWAIKPQNDPLPVVVRRMRLFAAEMLEPLGMAARFTVGDGVNGLHLPSEQRKEVYLIFKEAVHNCAKYSGAANVSVVLEKAGKQLVLSIHDDGAGFDQTLAEEGDGLRQGGNGLRNMRARAAALKAVFSIKSSPGAGTAVRLELPLVP